MNIPVLEDDADETTCCRVGGEGGVAMPTARVLLLAWACFMSCSHTVLAEDPVAPPDQPDVQRPRIGFYRWQEDWSVLADPRLRAEPGDAFKYIPLSKTNPKHYLSFGLTVRERSPILILRVCRVNFSPVWPLDSSTSWMCKRWRRLS